MFTQSKEKEQEDINNEKRNISSSSSSQFDKLMKEEILKVASFYFYFSFV
jgi:hypothetical protein